MRLAVGSFFVSSILLPFAMQVLCGIWTYLARSNPARRARIVVAVALPVAMVAGCDPCAGVSCSTTPHVTLTGTIVNHATGAGVSGAKIGLRATDPGGYSAETSVTTDASGVWQATVDLQTSGSANATVTVSAPNAPAYTATMSAETSTKRGDAIAVGLWTELPYIRELLSVLVSSLPLVGASVHFQRTSGPVVLAAQADAETDGGGAFELRFATETLGTLVGVLTITHPSLPTPIVLPDLAIQLDYHFTIAAVTGTILR
jgi:hypothetical protein